MKGLRIMKIAVTASDNRGLSAEIDSRFGRTPYFAVIETDNMKVDFIDNKAGSTASGAGVKAAQIMADLGVEAVISGNFGPKAFQGLQAAGIKLFSVKEGSIEDAVDGYKAGRLQELSEPTSNSHAGLNR